MASTQARPEWTRVGAALLVIAAVAFVPTAAPGADDRSTFIVELAGPPLTVSGGGRADLDATEDAIRRRAGVADAPVIYRYRMALNGFAARLTAAEAARLAADPGVLRVTPDRIRAVDAASDGARRPATAASGTAGTSADGVAFLGLRDGLWARLGGADHAGEGVVVGFLDTGVHPEHPSFADPGLPVPAGWAGGARRVRRSRRRPAPASWSAPGGSPTASGRGGWRRRTSFPPGTRPATEAMWPPARWATPGSRPTSMAATSAWGPRPGSPPGPSWPPTRCAGPAGTI